MLIPQVTKQLLSGSWASCCALLQVFGIRVHVPLAFKTEMSMCQPAVCEVLGVPLALAGSCLWVSNPRLCLRWVQMRYTVAIKPEARSGIPIVHGAPEPLA